MMAACSKRPEDGCSFIACTSAFLDRKCVCGTEVLADEAERLALTPEPIEEPA